MLSRQIPILAATSLPLLFLMPEARQGAVFVINTGARDVFVRAPGVPEEEGWGGSGTDRPGVEPIAEPGVLPALQSPVSVGLLRVGVLSRDSEQRAMLQTKLRRLESLQLCDPHTDQPHVLLCAAYSASETVALLASLPERHPRAVLLDRAIMIGPRIAALHGFLGYLAGEPSLQQYMVCFRKVAYNLPDASSPYDLNFLRYVQSGALDEEERSILQLSVYDYPQEQQAQQLHLSVSTLKRRLAQLKEKLELGRYHSVAAAAVELGLGRLWPISEDDTVDSPSS
jgi:DNA-binding CsgD family transcriptional regulator